MLVSEDETMILKPISTMAGAGWNILDGSGTRIAICGINDDMTVDYDFGKEVAEELVGKRELVFRTKTSAGWVGPDNPFYERLKKDAVAWAEIRLLPMGTK